MYVTHVSMAIEASSLYFHEAKGALQLNTRVSPPNLSRSISELVLTGLTPALLVGRPSICAMAPG